MRGIDLHFAHLHYEAPIIYISFKDNAEIGFLEVREMVYHAEQLSGHKPYVVFSDARWGVNVTPLGRKAAMDKHEAPLHRGTAVWVSSSALKIATNLFGTFTQPPFPYKAFLDKGEAVEWLKSLPLQSLRRLEL